MIIENLQVGDTVLVNKGNRGEGTKLVKIVPWCLDVLLTNWFQGDDGYIYTNDGLNLFRSIRKKVMVKN